MDNSVTQYLQLLRAILVNLAFMINNRKTRVHPPSFLAQLRRDKAERSETGLEDEMVEPF